MEWFAIYSKSGLPSGLNFTLQRRNWVDTCYLVNNDMIEKNYKSDMKILVMVFNKNTLSEHNVRIELKLQGRNLVAHRDIESHFFYHVGDEMKLDRLSNFRVRVKKRGFIEGEPGTTCRNYPNSEFISYGECDVEYMRRKVDYVATGLDLMPVWMAEDLSKVTTKPVAVESNIICKCKFVKSDVSFISCIPSCSV